VKDAAACARVRARLWDGPTRIVHWALVALIGFSWWSAETDHMDWHRLAGYGVLGLVVFRLYDHWRARKENQMVTGLAAALGWSTHRVKDADALYEIPAAMAEATVAAIRGKLNLRAGLRVVGDRKATIRRVLLFPGSMTPATMWQRYSEVDLIVAGEVREWENTHYAADMFAAGEKRALVTTGRAASEEPGMRVCAEWIKTVVKEVPAKWIGAGDPYWRPTV